MAKKNKKSDNTILYVAGGAALLFLFMKKNSASVVPVSTTPGVQTVAPSSNNNIVSNLTTGLSKLLKSFTSTQSTDTVPANTVTNQGGGTLYLDVDPVTDYSLQNDGSYQTADNSDEYMAGLSDEAEW